MATFLYNMDGSNRPPIVRNMGIANNQTLVRGDIVDLSGGLVAKAGTATGRVLGVMAEAITTLTAAASAQVYIAQPSQVWQQTASANVTSLVLDGMRTYDLNAAGNLNTTDTTGGSLQIVGVSSPNTEAEVTFSACVFA